MNREVRPSQSRCDLPDIIDGGLVPFPPWTVDEEVNASAGELAAT
jgi:hypothetical protein